MITEEDPLRGLLFYSDLGFSHTLRVLAGWSSGFDHQFDHETIPGLTPRDLGHRASPFISKIEGRSDQEVF